MAVAKEAAAVVAMTLLSWVLQSAWVLKVIVLLKRATMVTMPVHPVTPLSHILPHRTSSKPMLLKAPHKVASGAMSTTSPMVSEAVEDSTTAEAGVATAMIGTALGPMVPTMVPICLRSLSRMPLTTLTRTRSERRRSASTISSVLHLMARTMRKVKTRNLMKRHG